jgi:hypothetical protein
MRQALPLIYCIPEETARSLLGLRDKRNHLGIPEFQWVDWLPKETRQVITLEKLPEIDRLIRQAPRAKGQGY